MDWTKISTEQKKQFHVSSKSMVHQQNAFINDYNVELTVVATLDFVAFYYERYDVGFDVFLAFMKSCNGILEGKQIAEEVFKLHMTSNEFSRLDFEDIS